GNGIATRSVCGRSCFRPYTVASLLACSKLPIALDMAKDSNCKDRELRKRLEADSYMDCAVRECYASFKNIIKYLVEGEQEKKLGINIIFDEVDSCIEDGKLISDVNMRALPALL
ncbi:Callose synthase 3, partial [Ananas comosus]